MAAPDKHDSSSHELWRWDYVASSQVKSRTLQLTTALGLVIAGLIWWGIMGLRNGQSWVPLFVGLAASTQLAQIWSGTRRARSTSLMVDSNGQLHISDSASRTVIDLRTCDSIELRLRAANFGSNWSVEAMCQGRARTHELANSGSFFPLEKHHGESLGEDLKRWRSWATGGFETSPVQLADPAEPAGVQRTPKERQGQFRWAPPIAKNAARDRTMWQVCFAGATIGLVAAVLVTQWSKGLSAVAATMLAPTVVLIIGIAVDHAYARGAGGFELVAVDGQLTVYRSRGKSTSFQVEDVYNVEVSLSYEATASSGDSKKAIWRLRLDSRGESGEFVIPTNVGIAFDQTDAVELEASLAALIAPA